MQLLVEYTHGFGAIFVQDEQCPFAPEAPLGGFRPGYVHVSSSARIACHPLLHILQPLWQLLMDVFQCRYEDGACEGSLWAGAKVSSWDKTRPTLMLAHALDHHCGFQFDVVIKAHHVADTDVLERARAQFSTVVCDVRCADGRSSIICL